MPDNAGTNTDHDKRYLKRGAADFTSFTSKSAPVDADVALVEDSADSSNKKKITLSTIPGLTSSLVKNKWQKRVINYTAARLISSVDYTLTDDTLVETLTMAYDANNRISTITSTNGGEVVTVSRGGNGFLTGTVKT